MVGTARTNEEIDRSATSGAAAAWVSQEPRNVAWPPWSQRDAGHRERGEAMKQAVRKRSSLQTTGSRTQHDVPSRGALMQLMNVLVDIAASQPCPDCLADGPTDGGDQASALDVRPGTDPACSRQASGDEPEDRQLDARHTPSRAAATAPPRNPPTGNVGQRQTATSLSDGRSPSGPSRICAVKR